MTQPAYKLSIILLGTLPGKVTHLTNVRGASSNINKSQKKEATWPEKRVLVVVLIISFNCVLFAQPLPNSRVRLYIQPPNQGFDPLTTS